MIRFGLIYGVQFNNFFVNQNDPAKQVGYLHGEYLSDGVPKQVRHDIGADF